MSYRIGSFNVRNMSQNADSEKIEAIAKIIKSENFQIVVLQEVFCKNVTYGQDGSISKMVQPEDGNEPISSLLKNLGSSWMGSFGAPSQERKAKEGYAFLWNTKFFHLPEARLVNGQLRTYYPRIYNNYTIRKRDNQQRLIRNPFFARFIPNNQPKMELRIINVHLYFGKDRTQDYEKRRKEFEVISQNIYPDVSDRVYWGHDKTNLGSFYTIMIGDYNLNLQRPWNEKPFVSYETFEINDNGKIKKMRIFQESKTTLKTSSEDENEQQRETYSNNYDHSTYDVERFSSGIKCNTKVIDVVRKYHNNDFKEYFKNISDHIPICFEFENK
ncbi:MAG: hypothetical protein SPK10_10545 [Treponema sp.]|nr:hypothetical protein [Treponema sp.]MDY5765221.1 hypothetical protein [Treponema sp.]